MRSTLNHSFSSHYNFISCITLYFTAGNFNSFLGALKDCKKVTVSFFTAVRLSVRLSAWNSLVPTGVFSWKFIFKHFKKSVKKVLFISIGEK